MWYHIGYHPPRLFPLSIIPQSLSKSFGRSVVSSFLCQVVTESMGLANLKTFHLFRVWDIQMSLALP